MNLKGFFGYKANSQLEIPDRNLLRIYSAALSNDYHSIASEGELLYAGSLNILSEVLKEKELIDRSGMPLMKI